MTAEEERLRRELQAAEDAAFTNLRTLLEVTGPIDASRHLPRVPSFDAANDKRHERAEERAAEARRMRDQEGLTNDEIRRAMANPDTGKMPSPRTITNYLNPRR